MDQPTPHSSDESSLLPELVECYNDVQDSPKELQHYSPTLPLQWCGDIQAAFKENDDSAIDFQKSHGKLVFHTALWGTGAVILAIVGLAVHATLPKHQQIVLLVAETVAGALAAWATWRGTSNEYKEKWLLKRHQAELLRLLKYNFLLRPDIWRGKSEQSVKDWITDKIAEVTAMYGKEGQQKAALHMAVTKPSPHGPFEGVHTRLARREISSLVQYYVEKRLGPQKEFLANRAQRNEFKDQVRHWLPLFFLASIGAVFSKALFEVTAIVLEAFHHASLGGGVHTAVESSPSILGKLAGASEWIAIFIFAMLAALLPTFAAGIRLRLSAGEFARNKNRYESAHKALKELEESILRDTFAAVGSTNRPQEQGPDHLHIVREEEFLATSDFAQVRVRTEEITDADSNSGESDVDAYPVLRDLFWCEHILDAEHREWLRLMYDAEWFG